jgi:hypothetical protein
MVDPVSPDDGTTGVPEIEVGATGADLRYWKAKEAVRQGESRLAAQAAVRVALEARSTALTGWAAVSLLATTGAGFAAKDVAGFTGALVTGFILFAAAVLGIHAARPRNPSMVGYDPTVIISDPLESELEVLESIGTGFSPGIQLNNLRLTEMAKLLRWAGWLLIAAPVIGGSVYETAPAVMQVCAEALRRYR